MERTIPAHPESYHLPTLNNYLFINDCGVDTPDDQVRIDYCLYDQAWIDKNSVGDLEETAKTCNEDSVTHSHADLLYNPKRIQNNFIEDPM